MSDYITTIGLEIHAELRTKTKMFCNSKNDPDEKRPNVNVCPICMGHPGTLPMVNKEAMKHVLNVGVALGSELADFTEFDRKNYFYPDIPKGYQISQYKCPLVKGGSLNGVSITRIHLEEDTARSTHNDGDYSLVDFNRAGVPLMELVTEPSIHSAKEAGDFARELQLLLRYLGVAEANMEKGEMRVEANVSVATETAEQRGLNAEKRGKKKLGTKVEIKNLNSFHSVERAIEFEVARHSALLEVGEKVVQETRGWDDTKQKTFSQRTKEDSHDYRYFPDPDIPKFYLSEIPEFSRETLKKEIPELPWEKRARFKKEFGLKDDDIEIFVGDLKLAAQFGQIISNVEAMLPSKKRELTILASNYIVSDFLGLRKNSLEVRLPEDFAELIIMVGNGEISSRGAKDILAIAVLPTEKRSVKEIAIEKGLLQQSDTGALKKVVEEVIEENEKAVAEYKAGKTASLMFLVGQGMRKSRGSANPIILKTLFEKQLK